MQRIARTDLRESLSRKNLGIEADAAHLLHFAEKCVSDEIGRDFFFRARSFRGGIIFFIVENSAAAEKTRSAFFHVLPKIQAEFPAFAIREMRTKITVRSDVSEERASR